MNRDMLAALFVLIGVLLLIESRIQWDSESGTGTSRVLILVGTVLLTIGLRMGFAP